MPPRIGDYHAPADGTPESADPHFVARTRDCGFCGREFVTSAAFRYFCGCCRRLKARKETQRKVCPPVHRRGGGLE